MRGGGTGRRRLRSLPLCFSQLQYPVPAFAAVRPHAPHSLAEQLVRPAAAPGAHGHPSRRGATCASSAANDALTRIDPTQYARAMTLNDPQQLTQYDPCGLNLRRHYDRKHVRAFRARALAASPADHSPSEDTRWRRWQKIELPCLPGVSPMLTKLSLAIGTARSTRIHILCSPWSLILQPRIEALGLSLSNALVRCLWPVHPVSGMAARNSTLPGPWALGSTLVLRGRQWHSREVLASR